VGLLTKIFGNTDGGAESAVGRPDVLLDGEARSADGEQRVQARDADPGSSGIRPAVEAPRVQLPEEPPSAGATRRPEHPRMYLRPTPMRIDPSVPGSTRRPQIALRPTTGKESAIGRGPHPQTTSNPASAPAQASYRALEPPSPEVRSTKTPATGIHPKPAMVVSPVSLTAEELELAAGSRPKMQTLLGLGMGFGVEVPADYAGPNEAFPTAHARSRPMATAANERRIMRELFAALDGLLPAQRRRLEREMTLEKLALATPEELSRELETPIERARALSELVVSYFRERQTRAATDSLQSLSGALDELEQRSRELDEHDEDQDAEQRLARVRRRAALTRVNLLLAERGELDLLEVLEPCAIAERVERLREWLSSDARSDAARTAAMRQG
jgi:hypothetical protein